MLSAPKSLARCSVSGGPERVRSQRRHTFTALLRPSRREAAPPRPACRVLRKGKLKQARSGRHQFCTAAPPAETPKRCRPCSGMLPKCALTAGSARTALAPHVQASLHRCATKHPRSCSDNQAPLPGRARITQGPSTDLLTCLHVRHAGVLQSRRAAFASSLERTPSQGGRHRRCTLQFATAVERDNSAQVDALDGGRLTSEIEAATRHLDRGTDSRGQPVSIRYCVLGARSLSNGCVARLPSVHTTCLQRRKCPALPCGRILRMMRRNVDAEVHARPCRHHCRGSQTSSCWRRR